MLAMICVAYFRNIGRPISRNAVPKSRPRGLCVKRRTQAISTWLPVSVGTAVICH